MHRQALKNLFVPLFSCNWLNELQKKKLKRLLMSVLANLPSGSIPRETDILKSISVVRRIPGLVLVANAPYSGKHEVYPTGIIFDTVNSIKSKTLNRFARCFALLDKDEVPDFEAGSRMYNILMLNASMTYPERAVLWKDFLSCLLTEILRLNPNVQFVFMGQKARKLAEKVFGRGYCMNCFRHPVVASTEEMRKIVRIIEDYCASQKPI